MRFVSFEVSGRPSYGLIVPGGIADLGRRFGSHHPALADLIAADRLAAAAEFGATPADFELDAVKLLPVIPNPKHIYCVALNYHDHFREVSTGVKREPPAYPAVFLRAADSLTGHRQPIIRPKVSKQLDYEGELAVIIGKRGRHIAPADAVDYVAGYSCFNDASVRDWQKHTKQATPGKNFFSTGALGPWLVTRDEIADPHDLAIVTRLNGAVMQDSRTNAMLYDIPTFMAYVSAILPLEPGDVLATGTPSGVGYTRQPPVFLAPGDIVEVEIERVGTLVNTIADEE
jgi:2-keto-4-pentenoate hydratase/2-oxohepta-3-ene-1,7-dioic acid hydratase in catechol pathway